MAATDIRQARRGPITGSTLIYDINDPLAGKGEPVKTLSQQFPDLRRMIREGYLRYAFTRFGVPRCDIDPVSGQRAAKQSSCLPRGVGRRQRFLKALHISGGKPRPQHSDNPVHRGRAADGRVTRTSPIGRSARSSPTAAITGKAAAPIRRPMHSCAFRCATLPPTANSQSFLNWGRLQLHLSLGVRRRPTCQGRRLPLQAQ